MPPHFEGIDWMHWTPLWTPIDAVPFDRMWADDGIWFPHLLSGQPFRGRFLFDGDALLGYEVVLADETLAPGD
jgi:hypothetical protein